MGKHTAFLGRLAILLAVGLILVAGALLRGRPDLAEPVCWNMLEGASPSKQYVTWPGVTITPKGGKGMATARITSGSHNGSCDLCFKFGANTDQANLVNLVAVFGGVMATVSWQQAIPGGHRFGLFCGVPFVAGDYKEIDVMSPAAGQQVEVKLSASWVSGTSGLEMTHSTIPIGDKAATHAKECVVSEAWNGTIGDDCFTTVTFDGMTAEVPSSGMNFEFSGRFDPDQWGECRPYGAWFENIIFCGEVVDLSVECPPTKWHDATWNYPGYVPGQIEGLWEEGTADGTLGIWGPNYQGGPYVFDAWNGHTISAPYSHDFGGCYCKRMDGTDYDALVTCTAIRRLNADNEDIGPWKGRLSALRALGRIKQTTGFVSGSSRDPDLCGDVRMYLDRNAAEKDGIEVGFGRPDLKVEGAGWLAPRVSGVYNPETPSPLDGEFYADGEYNGETLYVNERGFKCWLKDIASGTWALGYGPGAPSAYEQEGGGPQGAYLYGDLPNLYYDPGEDEWVEGEIPEGAYTSLDPLPAVSASNSGTLADAGVPSFSHDLTFIFDGHTLAATSRTESPYCTDILSLTHLGAQDIYASAHTVEDWSPVNATAPDANSWFDVTAPNGTLTLTLASNFIARQAAVGTLNATPVPQAYWFRRHDSNFGNGIADDDHEAVYCWLGWGYYMTTIWVTEDLLGTTLTCTLRYYDDVGGAGDNHQTSERQENYSYSPGDLHTLTREIVLRKGMAYKIDGVTWYACPVTVDLNDAHSLAIVSSIEWAFADAGTYRFGPHLLGPDYGDWQANAHGKDFSAWGDPLFGASCFGGGPDGKPHTGRDEPLRHGDRFKAFENWRYSEGGLSAHYDGLARRSLWQLDNHKGNAVETCLGYLNPLYGKETGIDMTGVWTLAQIADLATWATDAWTLTHSPSAEAAAFVDADAVPLKTPVCSDIVPTMGGGTGPVVANRVYAIGAVNGLPYTHYGTHYVGGRAHGIIADAETGERVRVAGSVGLMRRPEGVEGASWSAGAKGVSSDEHGHWESVTPETLRWVGHKAEYWEYGAQEQSEEEPTLMGRMASREWQYANVTGLVYDQPYHCRDAHGWPIWRAALQAGNVVVHFRDGEDQGTYRLCGTAFASAEGDYVRPWIASCEDGSLLAGATDALTDTVIRRSTDGGATWGATMTALGAGLVYGTPIHHRGQTYLPGWSADKVYLAVSSATDLAREKMDGTNYLLEVCDAPVVLGAETPLAQAMVNEDGGIDVTVNMVTYRLRSPAVGFALVG